MVDDAGRATSALQAHRNHRRLRDRVRDQGSAVGLRDRHGHEGDGGPARRHGVLHGARETLQDEPDYAGAAAALERAKGTLRTKVGAGTGVRFTPTLSFVLDKVPDTAAHMEDLLARARAADEDLARVRQGAKHAGDEDPYRNGGGEGPAGSWITG